MVSKYSIFASIFLAIGFTILLVSLYAAIPSYSPSKPFTKNLYSCSINQDCGLNICDCVAQRDDTIENSDRACARACDGTVKCIDQKCQLIKPTPTSPIISTRQGWESVIVPKSNLDNYCANYPSFSISYPIDWDFKVTPIKEAWGDERSITISNQSIELNIYQACTGGEPRIMFEDSPYAKRDPNDVTYGKFVEFLSSSKKIRYFLSTSNDITEKYDEYVFSEELYNGTYTTHFIIGNITLKVDKSSSQQEFKEVEEIIKSIKVLSVSN